MGGSFLLRRIGTAIFTIAMIVLINFVLFRAMPGSPERVILRGTPNVTPAQLQAARERWGLDKPVFPEGSEGPSGPPAGSRNLRGTLESVQGDVLRVVDGENRKTYNVRFGDIRQARLEFEWPERRG